MICGRWTSKDGGVGAWRSGRSADGARRIQPHDFRDEVHGQRENGNGRARFEKLFERHGLPGAIRSDNGAPFASSQGLLGLSRLSAWWLALGIDLERGRPGCPQDNGAHERMHLDIRRELESGRIG